MKSWDVRITRIRTSPLRSDLIEFGGEDWSQSEDSVIDYIERDLCGYYIEAKGQALPVRIARRNGRKYLTTESDCPLGELLQPVEA
jgi:hypothetical protein